MGVSLIVAYLPQDDFDSAVLKTNQTMKDYWFVWSNDYEPIRVTYEDSIIVSALYRLHWRHFIVSSPYTNASGRVEAFFFPFSHTPIIRRERLDLFFYILIKNFNARKLDDYELAEENENIPEYFTSPGTKDLHFPPVEYEGWPELT